MPAAVTLSAFPVPLTFWIGAFMTNLMPADSRCSWTKAAMSGSAILGIAWSIISMTVTSFPAFLRATAASSPMTPAPPMTTCLASFSACSSLFPSLTVLIVKTFSRSFPSMGGTNTVLPVAMTRASYAYSLPPAVTERFSPSTALTEVSVTTSMPLSFP